MTRSKLHLVLATAVAVGVVVATAGDAFAGWRWHGSSGGSSGGWGGSSGGSSGGWGGSSGGWGGSSGGWGGSSGGWGGSSGGGSSGGWHHKHRRRGWGSSGGGWGSSGGSSGGWGGSSGGWSGGSSGGSSGGWGGSSGGGSSGGGAMYYAPAYDAVPVEGAVVPSTNYPPAGGTLPPVNEGTSIERANGLLTVEVPEDAKIFVNGQATSSTGDMRQYVSRDLQTGMNYSYEVRAEVTRDGKTVEQVKTIDLRAGENAKLAFDFAPASSVETSLTLHVPENAKVYLAGRETAAKGETRVFRTTSLSGGKAWSDYSVRVEFVQDGQTVVKEEKINLGAGESMELHFDANGDRVAAR